MAHGTDSATRHCRSFGYGNPCCCRTLPAASGSEPQSLVPPPAQARAITEAEGAVCEAPSKNFNLRRQSSLTTRSDRRDILVLQIQ